MQCVEVVEGELDTPCTECATRCSSGELLVSPYAVIAIVGMVKHKAREVYPIKWTGCGNVFSIFSPETGERTVQVLAKCC